MTPDKAMELIQEACWLRPELRFPDWQKAHRRKMSHKGFTPLQGYCYIATQVFCHLIKAASPYVSGEGKDAHWWAQIGDKVYDPTASQFSVPFPYETGKKRNRRPDLTERSKELLSTIRAGY